MKMFAAGTEIMRRLLRLSVKGNTPAKDDELPANDELVLARIAQAYPELIVMAGELRDYRV